MLAPGSGVTGSHATQCSLQRLISPLRLPIGLGMVPGGQTDHGPNPATEGLPHPRRELGSTVGDNVQGNTMKPDHMGNEKVRGFRCGREFREGGEINHLREPVDHGQDGCVALGRRKARDEVMWDYGRPGMGRGRSSPAGGRCDALLRAHTLQAATNSRMSASRVGQQKCRQMNWLVLEVPGWQANWLEWPHTRTRLRTDSGMKRRFRGPPAGAGCAHWAARTAGSRPQVTTPTTLVGGRMVCGLVVFGVTSPWYRREKASARTFLEPGL